MILYLLFLILILGEVESQTDNTTEEEKSKVERNQTFRESITNNSTMKPGSPTPSLDKDERRLIQEELQNNQTSSVITEDDESFQDQENKFQGGHCQEEALEEYGHILCDAKFHTQMMSISAEDWCVMENIIRPYNDMALCLEIVSNFTGCYYPNPITQDIFRSVHSYYFHDCSKEELPFEDAPHGLVVALTLVPVSLIPVLVYLVVWKSSVQV
ncbi:receptor activity-modifying protein 1 [Anarhichas minor]|uniref:receptor activity-modifying protein 1 n=1 Tax=Anarhichas minor TaxID=65739 RepID=UPI003F73F353